VIRSFSDFRYVDPFRRYLRPKQKVVENRAEFRTIFAIAYFRGRAFQKLYTRYHPCLAARRLEKFPGETLTSPEVIDSNTLNFRPNYKFSRSKFLGRSRPTCGER